MSAWPKIMQHMDLSYYIENGNRDLAVRFAKKRLRNGHSNKRFLLSAKV